MSLEGLPPEAIECIVELLPLPDICSLRLTNRVLASKATQQHFKAYFRAKVSPLGLRKLVIATESVGLQGSLLRQLTLIAPAYNLLELEACFKHKATSIPVWADDGTFEEIVSRDLSSDELQCTEHELQALRQLRNEHSDFVKRGDDVALLSQAFANLANHANHGAILQCICTEVAVDRIGSSTFLPPLYGGGWKSIWASAARGFKAIFASLANTGLPTQSLELFIGDQMQRCSLACDQLIDVDFSSGLMRACLGEISMLSMSISDKIIDQSTQDPMDIEDYCGTVDVESLGVFRPIEDIIFEAADESTFARLSSMLRRCCQLKELDISHFELDHSSPEVTLSQSQGILQAIRASRLINLRKVSLQGFDTSDTQLPLLLRSLPALQVLFLKCITLSEGSAWTRVLDHCTTKESGIAELDLDSLFEPKILLFEPPYAIVTGVEQSQDCYVGLRARYVRPSASSASTFKAPRIGYRLHPGRPKRSFAAPRWDQDLKNRYGPPRFGAEACLRHVLPPEDI